MFFSDILGKNEKDHGIVQIVDDSGPYYTYGSVGKSEGKHLKHTERYCKSRHHDRRHYHQFSVIKENPRHEKPNDKRRDHANILKPMSAVIH